MQKAGNSGRIFHLFDCMLTLIFGCEKRYSLSFWAFSCCSRWRCCSSCLFCLLRCSMTSDRWKSSWYWKQPMKESNFKRCQLKIQLTNFKTIFSFILKSKKTLDLCLKFHLKTEHDRICISLEPEMEYVRGIFKIFCWNHFEIMNMHPSTVSKMLYGTRRRISGTLLEENTPYSLQWFLHTQCQDLKTLATFFKVATISILTIQIKRHTMVVVHQYIQDN